MKTARSVAATALLAFGLAGCSDAWDATQLNTLRGAVDHRETANVDAILEALAYIEKQPAPIALPLVIDLSKDEVEDVRYASVAALAAYSDPSARAALNELKASDKSELVREEATTVLARMAGGKK